MLNWRLLNRLFLAFALLAVAACGDIVPSETPDAASALCGNGDLDPGETCDPVGSCPTECASQDVCTTAELVGEAATCTAECVEAPIEVCVSGDGCCPASCDAVSDSDCAVAALVITTGAFPDHTADVVDKQLATGAFTTVDSWDVNALGTPTLEDLLVYDVALIFTADVWPEPDALGDVVADYFDNGGRVVQAVFAVTSILALGGRWSDPTQGYQLIEIQDQDQNLVPDSLGVVREPMSPLMSDVQVLDAETAYRAVGNPLPGVTVVAEWGAGLPLVVRGEVNGRSRVDLNFYPASAESAQNFGFWTGDGAELIRNALLFR